MTRIETKLRTSRILPLSNSASKSRKITDEALVSLRAFRRDRLASRALPHQPRAA